MLAGHPNLAGDSSGGACMEDWFGGRVAEILFRVAC